VSPAGEYIYLRVIWNGCITLLLAEASSTIASLKQTMQHHVGVPFNRLQLKVMMATGSAEERCMISLDDSHTVGDYHLDGREVLHMMPVEDNFNFLSVFLPDKQDVAAAIDDLDALYAACTGQTGIALRGNW